MTVFVEANYVTVSPYGMRTKKDIRTAKDNGVFQFSKSFSRDYKYFCSKNRNTRFYNANN